MSEKISQLTSGNPAEMDDLIPIARSGSNYSVTAASVAALGGGVNPSQAGRFLWSSGSTDNGYAVPAFNTVTVLGHAVGSGGGECAFQVFTLINPLDVEISELVFYLTSSLDADTSLRFGLYSADGNTKFIDVGIPPSTSMGLMTLTFSSFVLDAGVYKFAQAAISDIAFDNPTVSVTGWNTTSSESLILDGFNPGNGTLRNGKSTNVATSSSLPSTIGTIVTDTNGLNLAAVIFQ